MMDAIQIFDMIGIVNDDRVLLNKSHYGAKRAHLPTYPRRSSPPNILWFAAFPAADVAACRRAKSGGLLEKPVEEQFSGLSSSFVTSIFPAISYEPICVEPPAD